MKTKKEIEKVRVLAKSVGPLGKGTAIKDIDGVLTPINGPFARGKRIRVDIDESSLVSAVGLTVRTVKEVNGLQPGLAAVVTAVRPNGLWEMKWLEGTCKGQTVIVDPIHVTP